MNTDNSTTVLPSTHTSSKPVGSQLHTDSVAGTILQETETGVPQTENIPLSDAEKAVLLTDDKLTTTVTSTTSIPTISSFAAESEASKQIPDEVHNNSVTSIIPLLDHEINGLDSESDRKEEDGRDFSEEGEEPDSMQMKEIEQTAEEIDATKPQNMQVPPRGIIVISDGLLSERRDGDMSGESRSGVWNLVSSASVAGGVALLLIVMAAVTLLVSHRRTKEKVSIAEKEMASFRMQQVEQQQPLPGPQMYNCTENITTLPRESRLTSCAMGLLKALKFTFCTHFAVWIEIGL